MTLPSCNTAARQRTLSVYAKTESTAGTAETLAAINHIELIEDPTLPNPFAKADLENLTRTSDLSPNAMQKGNTVAQEFSFKTYVYHSSGSTTAPHLSQLWEGLTGTETVGTSSVTYTASAATAALDNLTFLIVSDNSSMSFSGKVDKAEINIAPSDDPGTLLSVTWTVQVQKWYFYAAGRATGNASGAVVTMTNQEDAGRFSVNGIVDIDSTARVVSSVDTSAGTITLTTSPAGGAVSITPWTPGLPTSTWSEYQFLSQSTVVKITTVSGVASEEYPTRDMTFTWNNALVVRNNETSRGVGTMCINRVNLREQTVSLTAIQYDSNEEFNTALADNRNVELEIISTALDGSTRTFTIHNSGVAGAFKLTNPSGGNEDGLQTQSFDAKAFATGENFLALNGIDEGATVADNASLSITGDMTIEAVFVSNVVDSTDFIIDKINASDEGYSLTLGSNGSMAFNNGDGTAGENTTAANVIEAGVVYRAKFAYDASAGNGEWFINRIASTSASNTLQTSIVDSAEDLFVGSSNGVGNFFNGNLYSVAIANTYQSNEGSLDPDDAATVAYWTFDGNLTDASGEGNTLTGANIDASNYGNNNYDIVQFKFA